MTPVRDPINDSVREGVILACGLHFCQILIVPLISTIVGLFAPPRSEAALGAFFFSIAGWSVTQFLYLGPAAWLANRKGLKQKARGILIVAGIGVLLNGGCDVLMMAPSMLH